MNYKEQRDQAFYMGIFGTVIGTVLLVLGAFVIEGKHRDLVMVTGLTLIFICTLVLFSIVSGMMLNSIVNDAINDALDKKQNVTDNKT